MIVLIVYRRAKAKMTARCLVKTVVKKLPRVLGGQQMTERKYAGSVRKGALEPCSSGLCSKFSSRGSPDEIQVRIVQNKVNASNDDREVLTNQPLFDKVDFREISSKTS